MGNLVRCEKCQNLHDDSFAICPYCPTSKRFDKLTNIATALFVASIIFIFINFVIAIIIFITFISVVIYASKKYPEEYQEYLEKHKKDQSLKTRHQEYLKQQQKRYAVPTKYSYETYKDVEFHSEIGSSYNMCSGNNTYNNVKNNFANLSDEKLYKQYDKFADEKYWIMKRAKFGNIKIEDFENGVAKVRSSDGNNFYQTTIRSCTCPYFQKTGEICKHMWKVVDLIGFYPLLNDNTEREIVLKLWDIYYELLLPKFRDVVWACAGKGCYLKINKDIETFANMGIISIIEPALSDIVAKKYSKDELSGFLLSKNLKKSITKTELVEEFLKDEKLKKMIKIKEKIVKLNFEEQYHEFIRECMNHLNYHYVEKNSIGWD